MGLESDSLTCVKAQVMSRYERNLQSVDYKSKHPSTSGRCTDDQTTPHQPLHLYHLPVDKQKRRSTSPDEGRRPASESIPVKSEDSVHKDSSRKWPWHDDREDYYKEPRDGQDAQWPTEQDAQPLTNRPRQNTLKSSLPTLSMVEVVAFRNDQIASGITRQSDTGSAMYSSFLTPITQPQKRPLPTRRPRLAKPHPSATYPDLSLSSAKLNLPKLPVNVENTPLRSCVFHFSHHQGSCLPRSQGGKLRSRLPQLILNPHNLSESFKQKHTDYFAQLMSKSSTKYMNVATNYRETLYNKEQLQRKDLSFKTQRRTSNGKSHNSSREQKEQGYPDPWRDAPVGFQRRLAQLTLHVSATITWEAGKRSHRKK